MAFGRLNIIQIIDKHFSTYPRKKYFEENKFLGWKDTFLFILIPVILSLCSLFLQIEILDSFLNALIAVFSIFSGFLFNLLALVYSQIDKIKNDLILEKKNLSVEIKKQFVKNIHYNISYLILISIIILILLLLKFLDFSKYNFYIEYHSIKINYLTLILNGFIYFSIIHFTITLLNVLYRLFVLFDKEVDFK